MDYRNWCIKRNKRRMITKFVNSHPEIKNFMAANKVPENLYLEVADGIRYLSERGHKVDEIISGKVVYDDKLRNDAYEASKIVSHDFHMPAYSSAKRFNPDESLIGFLLDYVNTAKDADELEELAENPNY